MLRMREPVTTLNMGGLTMSFVFENYSVPMSARKLLFTKETFSHGYGPARQVCYELLFLHRNINYVDL